MVDIRPPRHIPTLPFRFYLTILAVLIFVNQEDGDLRRGS
jgi:predicted small integral membrane protein